MRSSIVALVLSASLATALPQNLYKRQEPEASAAASSAPSEDGSSAYPCPEGYELTYVEEQQTYPYSFDILLNAQIADWTVAP